MITCKQTTLISHPIFCKPSSQIALDIMTVFGSNSLITVDFYSDFWELDTLPKNLTAAGVIWYCKRNFIWHGIPDLVAADMLDNLITKNLSNWQRNENLEQNLRNFPENQKCEYFQTQVETLISEWSLQFYIYQILGNLIVFVIINNIFLFFKQIFLIPPTQFLCCYFKNLGIFNAKI